MHDFWILNSNVECLKLPIYICIYIYVDMGGNSRKSIKHFFIVLQSCFLSKNFTKFLCSHQQLVSKRSCSSKNGSKKTSWELRSAHHPEVRWSLWSLGDVDKKFPQIKGVLWYGGDGLCRAKCRRGTLSCSTATVGSNEVEGPEGQELFIPVHWWNYLGNNASEEDIQGNLGFYEEEVSRLNESKACLTSSG